MTRAEAVLNIIQHFGQGRENAICAREIAVKVRLYYGISLDARAVRAEVAVLVAQHKLIGATAGHGNGREGGFFIPATLEESGEVKGELTSRVNLTAQRLRNYQLAEDLHFGRQPRLLPVEG